jgi:integrase
MDTKVRRERKGHTDDEARLILSAAIGAFPRLSSVRQAARRWIPWLAAYSGARLGEIAQLQKADVRQQQSVWMIGFPGAYERRFVPVHPHLIEQGFIAFVEQAADGSLFYDAPVARRSVEPWDRVVADYGKWIRSLGLTDPNLVPAHAWRHRFASVAERFDINPAIVHDLMGHGSPLASDRMLPPSPATLAREISKLPRYEVG